MRFIFAGSWSSYLRLREASLNPLCYSFTFIDSQEIIIKKTFLASFGFVSARLSNAACVGRLAAEEARNFLDLGHNDYHQRHFAPHHPSHQDRFPPCNHLPDAAIQVCQFYLGETSGYKKIFHHLCRL